MKVLVILLFLLCCSFCLVSCNKGQGESEFIPVTVFDPDRNAAKDIELAVQEAKRSGKYVLLDVGGNWCTWCIKFDQFFKENEDIREYLHQKFVLVKINFSPDNRNKEVLSRFPAISGYPHLFVLDDTGILVHSQDSTELEQGDGHDREKVLKFLNKWAPDMDGKY